MWQVGEQHVVLLKLKITKSETSEHATQTAAPSRMPRCPSEAARTRDVRTSCGRMAGWADGVRMRAWLTATHMKISHENLLPCLRSVRMK